MLFEAFGEFIDPGDAAGFEYLLLGGVGAGECYVFPNGSVKQERFLQHDAELGAIRIQTDGGEIDAVDQHGSRLGSVEGGDQADNRGFSGAGGAHESRHCSWLGAERDLVQYLFAGVVCEVHLIENYLAVDGRQRHGPARVLIFWTLAEHLARSFQSGQRFGELRSDVDQLKHRRDQECKQRGERDKIAQRHDVSRNLARAHVHDDGAHRAHQDGGRKAHERSGGEAFQDIVEQPLYAGFEHCFFAGLGVIALDHANAAQGFGKTPGNLGVDFAALAEDGADGAECLAQHGRESDDDHRARWK